MRLNPSFSRRSRFFSQYKSIIVDTANPTLTSASPADNSTGIAIASDIVLTFSEVDGKWFYYYQEKVYNSIIEVIDVTSNQVTGSGTSKSPLTPLMISVLLQRHIQIETTAFDDIAGNSYAGIVDSWAQVGSDIDELMARASKSISFSDGSTIAIAASKNDSNGTSSGHVRVYENNNEL